MGQLGREPSDIRRVPPWSTRQARNAGGRRSRPDHRTEVRTFVASAPHAIPSVRRVLPRCSIPPPALPARPGEGGPCLHAARPGVHRRRPRRKLLGVLADPRGCLPRTRSLARREGLLRPPRRILPSLTTRQRRKPLAPHALRPSQPPRGTGCHAGRDPPLGIASRLIARVFQPKRRVGSPFGLTVPHYLRPAGRRPLTTRPKGPGEEWCSE